MIQLLVIIASGACFSIGGWHILAFRRIVMPLILTVTCLYLTHSYWSLTILASYGVLTLGYGDKSPFRHIFGQSWGRGVWSFLVALALSLGLLLKGHIDLWLFIPYLIAGFFVEPLLKNIWQVVGDFIIGVVLASVVLIVH